MYCLCNACHCASRPLIKKSLAVRSCPRASSAGAVLFLCKYCLLYRYGYEILETIETADYGIGADGGRDRRGFSAHHRQVWEAGRDVDGIRLVRRAVFGREESAVERLGVHRRGASYRGAVFRLKAGEFLP